MANELREQQSIEVILGRLGGSRVVGGNVYSAEAMEKAYLEWLKRSDRRGGVNYCELGTPTVSVNITTESASRYTSIRMENVCGALLQPWIENDLLKAKFKPTGPMAEILQHVPQESKPHFAMRATRDVFGNLGIITWDLVTKE